MVAALAVLSAIEAYRSFFAQLDDAYIAFSYVQNILEGNGWVFNPGENVNAATAPLHVITLVPLGFLCSGNVPLAAAILEGLCVFGGAVVAFFLLAKRQMIIPGIVFSLMICIGPFWGVAYGMESSLVLFLVLLAVYMFDAEHYTACSFFAALGCLARPDTVLLAPLLLLLIGIREKRVPLRHAFIYAAVGLPWLLFSYLEFGNLLPATFAAKRAHKISGGWNNFLYDGAAWWFIKTLIASRWQRSLFLIAMFLGSCSLFVQRLLPGWIIVSWGLLHYVVYAFVLNPPCYGWYLLPEFAAIYLVASVGAGSVPSLLNRWIPVRLGTVIAISLAVFLVMPWAGNAIPRRPSDATTAVTYKGIGAWLSENVSSDASVAMCEIGTVKYYSGLRVIDIIGLTHPKCAEYLANRQYGLWIEEYKPDYILRHRYDYDFEKYAWRLCSFDQYVLVKCFEHSLGGNPYRLYRRRPADFFQNGYVTLEPGRFTSKPSQVISDADCSPSGVGIRTFWNDSYISTQAVLPKGYVAPAFVAHKWNIDKPVTVTVSAVSPTGEKYEEVVAVDAQTWQLFQCRGFYVGEPKPYAISLRFSGMSKKGDDSHLALSRIMLKCDAGQNLVKNGDFSEGPDNAGT